MDSKFCQCGKRIKLKSKMCRSCHSKITLHRLDIENKRAETNRRKISVLGYWHSKEVRKEMSSNRRGKDNPNYRDGSCLVTFCCMDCGSKISRASALYKEGRCNSCKFKLMWKINPPLPRYGEMNNNWRGGITPLARIIRGLDEYKNWVKQVFKRDNFTCKECGVGKNLEVHHRYPFAVIFQEFLKEYNQFSPIEDRETLVRLSTKYTLFWDVSNGQTLCKGCHNKVRKQTISEIRRK